MNPCNYRRISDQAHAQECLSSLPVTGCCELCNITIVYSNTFYHPCQEQIDANYVIELTCGSQLIHNNLYLYYKLRITCHSLCIVKRWHNDWKSLKYSLRLVNRQDFPLMILPDQWSSHWELLFVPTASCCSRISLLEDGGDEVVHGRIVVGEDDGLPVRPQLPHQGIGDEDRFGLARGASPSAMRRTSTCRGCLSSRQR